MRRALVTVAACVLLGVGFAHAQVFRIKGGNFGPAVQWHTFTAGGNCLLSQPLTAIANNSAQLSQVWGEMFGADSAPPAGINWVTEMVVVVAAGRQSSPGAAMAQSIERTSPTEITVSWFVRRMPSGLYAPDSGSTGESPWELEVVNRTSGVFRFSRNPDTTAGNGLFIVPGGGFGNCGPYDACPWQVIGWGPNCLANNEGTLVIESQDGLSQYWGQSFDSSIQVPDGFDFTNQVLIAVNLGQRPTAGYSVVVRGIRSERSGLVLFYSEVQPSPSLVVSQVLTSPYVFLRAPRTRQGLTVRKIPFNDPLPSNYRQ